MDGNIKSSSSNRHMAAVHEAMLSDDTSLRQYWSVLRRYRWIVFCVTIAVFCSGLYYAYIQPQYFGSTVYIRKESGFGQSQRLFGNKLNSGQSANDIERMSEAPEVTLRALELVKELPVNGVYLPKLTSEEREMLDSLMPEDVNGLYGVTFDKKNPNIVSLNLTFPKSGVITALLANGVAYALAEISNENAKKINKKNEEMIEHLIKGKIEELKNIEKSLHDLQGKNIVGVGKFKLKRTP